MITIKADDRRRVQIPGIKAGQVFAFEDQGNGVRILTEVKKTVKEPFPRGSLKYLCTPARNKELEHIASAGDVPVKQKNRPGTVKFVKKDGFTVGVTDRQVSTETIKELLADFK